VSAELAGIALDVAREAAELVRARRAKEVRVADTKTSSTDVVTEADRASEQLIRSLILERRPDDAVLGEEAGSQTGTSGVRWIVDPIDGTVNFLYGIRQYAVSIAAERDGRTVAGVVLNVADGTEFVAYRDGDGDSAVATRDGAPIEVNGPAPLQQRLVATGFSYDPAVRARQARSWGLLLPRVRDLRRMGSAALDICMVAEGGVDAYVEEGVNPWDYAAAALVAEAAGGQVELLVGASGMTLLVCAPRHGFAEFREAVLACGFASGGTVEADGSGRE
jgi:myo-inositol-1(or 4)-monophosphatase